MDQKDESAEKKKVSVKKEVKEPIESIVIEDDSPKKTGTERVNEEETE